ncbi:Protein rcc2 [Desmophyllum pertusum]|uniref:Protein rcc2 n=1 Tax=Desmophyllum pertusum TaxID=174260 RepID=A0A9X0A666_9CNID|nr:Protein rcc2 [Desmophyllum pertusum]
MTTPEIPSGKRKELENYDEDNSKKSKIECSDDSTLVDSPGQEDTAENHFTDETLAEKISGEAKEVDDVQSTPLPNTCGKLLISGGTNWDLVGRKEAPKYAANAGGPNLWEPHSISSLSNIRVQLVASGPSACHSIIICEDGTVMSFGRNDNGQLGHGDMVRCDKPKIIDSLKHYTIVQASCGKAHTLVLTAEGILFGFGGNKMAQLGQGHQKPVVAKPVQIVHPTNKKIIKAVCGAEFSMLIDENNLLYSFGRPEHGQLGHNTDGQYFVTANKLSFDCEVLPRHVAVFVEKTKDGFTHIMDDVKVVDASCGNNHTIVRDSKDRVFTWGFGGYGRLGHQQPKDELIPRLVSFLKGKSVSSVHAGSSFSMALSMGQLYFWGQTKSTGDATMYPKPVRDMSGWDVRSVGCSKTSIVLAADESVVSWGPCPTYGELIVQPLEGVYIQQVACGLGHTLYIARDDEKDRPLLDKIPVYDPEKV